MFVLWVIIFTCILVLAFGNTFLLKITLILLIVEQVVFFFIIKNKDKKIQKLKKLMEIGKKITSNIKLKNLLKDIMEITKKETEAEASSLYLLDEEHNELWFEVALGEKGDQVKEIRLKVGEGIAGWVAQEGKALNLNDVNNDTRFKREIGEKICFKQRAMLTVPVKFKDRTVGVLQLINKVNNGNFDEEDQELLEGLSSQIAISIDNAKLYEGLRELFISIIRSLANAIDARDPYTKGHSIRVANLSTLIGKKMGLTEERLELLEYMGILHDIGKIGISDEILIKPGKLENDEFQIMKSHPKIGADILNSVNLLKEIVSGVQYHHEQYDGSGYIMGLKGDEIPLEARIIAIADTYDAMTSDRPYREGLEHSAAIDEIKEVSGTQLDPQIVSVFFKVMEEKNSKAVR